MREITALRPCSRDLWLLVGTLGAKYHFAVAPRAWRHNGMSRRTHYYGASKKQDPPPLAISVPRPYLRPDGSREEERIETE